MIVVVAMFRAHHVMHYDCIVLVPKTLCPNGQGDGIETNWALPEGDSNSLGVDYFVLSCGPVCRFRCMSTLFGIRHRQTDRQTDRRTGLASGVRIARFVSENEMGAGPTISNTMKLAAPGAERAGSNAGQQGRAARQGSKAGQQATLTHCFVLSPVLLTFAGCVVQEQVPATFPIR